MTHRFSLRISVVSVVVLTAAGGLFVIPTMPSQARARGVAGAVIQRVSLAGAPTSTSLPQPGTSRSLSAISCVSPSDCWAVGTYASAHGPNHNQILMWRGSAWKLMQPPNPSEGGDLNGISCTSSKNCWAVGATDNPSCFCETANESLQWTGSSWVLRKTLNQSSACFSSCNFRLDAVRCPSPQECVATGTDGEADGWYNQAIEWAATKWTTLAPPPGPSGGDDVGRISELFGLACLSGKSCWAVGNTGCQGSCSGGADEVFSWNGSQWSDSKAPAPGNVKSYASGPQLNGVTCSSASRCWAVGYYYNGKGHQQNQILRWDGKSWSLAPAPGHKPGDTTSLAAVACPSASSCWAVGSGDGASNQILHWNGKVWSAVSAPRPGSASNGYQSRLTGVACLSGKRCWAVGSYSRHSGPTFNEALSWNGKVWSLVA